MTHAIALSEVPGKYLDQKNWNFLKKQAPVDLIALTYINAPYPSEDGPSDFFWHRTAAADEGIHGYQIGKSLLKQARLLLQDGRLVATGIEENTGERKVIPANEWGNLWPMFATNTAVGPDSGYFAIEIFEAPPETTREKLLIDCIVWLKGQRVSDTRLKRSALHADVKRALANNVSHSIFDAAYRSVFGRRRGRPKSRSRKLLSSDESIVIPCVAPESQTWGAACGSLNTVVLPITITFAIRAI